MLDYMNGPCMFAEFPLAMRDVFPSDVFANVSDASCHGGKRRCHRNKNGNKYYHNKNTQRVKRGQDAPAVRYTIDAVGKSGYELTLYKEIPAGMLEAAVQKAANELVEKLYVPNYHVVEDIFGRQYYVEEEMDAEQLREKVLSSININDIKKKLARKLFLDYRVELSHRGDEVLINSDKDGISQEFNFENELDDIRIKSCAAVDDKTVSLCVELKTGYKELVCKSATPRTVDVNFKLAPSAQNKLEERKAPFRTTTNKEETESEDRADDERSIDGDSETATAINSDFKLTRENKQEQLASDAESTSASESGSDDGNKKMTITKVYSPILENVEDEEIDRYKKSFEHSPKGYALVEDY